MRMIVVIPVFNDWTAVGLLLEELDPVLLGQGMDLEILIIDDASTEPVEASVFCRKVFQTIKSIEILRLRRNLGHQRAIAVALAFLDAHRPFDVLAIMDGDGEDNPRDLPRLLECLRREGGRKIVFAKRIRRSEGLLFSTLYHLYRWIHFVLTGVKVRVGNFSLVPAPLAHQLVVMAEMWNHYAATVLRAGLPYAEVPSPRGRRLAGRTQMNLIRHVVHGLSAISVYGDLVGARALVAGLTVGFASIIALGVVLGIRVATDAAIPGWASYLTMSLLILGVQMVMLAMLFVFLILATRKHLDFIPCRDYGYFVLELRKVFPSP